VRKGPAVIIFTGLSVLFWLALGALLIEGAERYLTRAGLINERVAPIISEVEKQDMAVYDATADSAPRPAREVAAKYPDLGALDGAGKARLDELASQWDGILFECDTRGNISGRHVATGSKLAVLLNARTASVANISAITPPEHPEYGRDLLFKLERALDEWRNPQPRLPHMTGGVGPWVDYVIPLPDYPVAGFRFMFRPVKQPGTDAPLVYTVVVPWRWEAVFGGFRANYYERDTYPQFQKSEFWTNSRGFRDEEITAPKPKGVYRILCIGGSTALEGPRNDLTYPKMLQKMLREHFKTNAIEVVNCGVDGGTVSGQCARFDDCLALQPDMVIHYSFGNEASMLIDNTLKNTVLKSAWRRGVMNIMGRSKFLAHHCRRLWVRTMPKEQEYGAEIEKSLWPPFLELSGRTKRAGARFVLASVAIPDMPNLPSADQAWFRNRLWMNPIIKIQFDDYALVLDAFNAMLRAFCSKEGAAYVPVAEELKGGLETFTDLMHMHVAGSRRKAQIMFNHLADLIEGDWKDRGPVAALP